MRWRPGLAAVAALAMIGFLGACEEETRRIGPSEPGGSPSGEAFSSAAPEVLTTPIAAVPPEAPRTALVIGNGLYRSLGSLDNPGNDANLIAGALEELGFQLVGGAAQTDLDQNAMAARLSEYRQTLAARGGIGVVYFAGHGVQVAGRNFLAPVDTAPSSMDDIPAQMTALGDFFTDTSGAADMNLVILDACRNNPFWRRDGRSVNVADPALRTVSAGLSEVIAPPGSLVAFATAPGDVALDGSGENSPYAEAVAAALREPGLRIEDMFIRVRNIVDRTTDGAQVPWETSSLTKVAVLNPTGARQSTARFDGTWTGKRYCETLPTDPAGVTFDGHPREFEVSNGRGRYLRGDPTNSETAALTDGATVIDFTFADDATVYGNGIDRCCWFNGRKLAEKDNTILFSGTVTDNNRLTMTGTRGTRQCRWEMQRFVRPSGF